MLQSKGLYIGTYFGVPIYIHSSWLIVFLIAYFSLAFHDMPALYPEGSQLVWNFQAIIVTLLFFVSVLLHELSHSLIAIRQKIGVREITLYVFGGAAKIEREPKSPSQEVFMSIAGPGMSFFLSFIYYAIFIFLENVALTSAATIFYVLGIVNFYLGIFNLMPAFPLDGGRVFRSFIWKFKKDKLKATVYSVRLSWLLSAGLFLTGMYFVFRNDFQGFWLIFISFVLFRVSFYSLYAARHEWAWSKKAIEYFEKVKAVDVGNHEILFSGNLAVAVLNGEVIGIIEKRGEIYNINQNFKFSESGKSAAECYRSLLTEGKDYLVVQLSPEDFAVGSSRMIVNKIDSALRLNKMV